MLQGLALVPQEEHLALLLAPIPTPMAVATLNSSSNNTAQWPLLPITISNNTMEVEGDTTEEEEEEALVVAAGAAGEATAVAVPAAGEQEGEAGQGRRETAAGGLDEEHWRC